MESNKGNSLYTKKGFSKVGFGCCSFFAKCKMGELECYHFESGEDTEMRNYCSTYQRHHKNSKTSTETPIEYIKKADTAATSKLEQLSLF